MRTSIMVPLFLHDTNFQHLEVTLNIGNVTFWKPRGLHARAPYRAVGKFTAGPGSSHRTHTTHGAIHATA